MRIKRFNENQHYLTDPLDPEKEIVFTSDFTDQVKDVEKDLEKLAKELGLIFNIKGNQYIFYNTDEIIRTYRWIRNNDGFFHSIMLMNTQSDDGDYGTIGDIKDDLIEYFDLK